MTPNPSPSPAWERLLPADAVALPAAPDAPRMAQLIAAAAGALPDAPPAFVARVLRLFGPEPAGIAIRLGGRSACVDVAERLVRDRAARDRAAREGLLPPQAVQAWLDALEGQLRDMSALQFPELVQPPEPRRQRVLHFQTVIHSTSLHRYLGARCHLFLARKSAELAAKGSADVNHSLSSVVTPLRHLARGFDFDRAPDLALVDRDPQTARALGRQVAAFFDGLAKRRALSERLSTSTHSDYDGTFLAALDAPSLHGARAQRLLRNDSQPSGGWNLDVLDDDPPEDDADPYSLARYAEAARQDDLDSADDPADLAVGAGAAVFGAEDGSIDEDIDSDLAGLLDAPVPAADIAQAAARSNYARECAVLSLHTTPLDTATLPMRVLALGYAALMDGGRTPLQQLPYARLSAVCLLHLLLMTGRSIDDLLDIRVGAPPADHRQACAHPVYDAAAQRLFASPRIHPAMRADLRDMPDPAAQPQAHLRWRAALKAHERLYLPITQAREIILDDASRRLLQRAAAQRLALPGLPAAGGTDHLFVVLAGGQWQPLTREHALEAVTRPMTAFVRSILPSAPAITFARLRHTAWAHLVGQHGLHPILMQMQADRRRMELYSHGFYACVPRSRLAERAGAAQEAWLTALLDAHADLRTTLRNIAALEFRRGDAIPAPASESFYGACYCPRREVLRAIVLALLRDLPQAPRRHADADSARRAAHDALTHLCALLTAICCGTRISELEGIQRAAVDLDYAPPLVTLMGKSNRFTEEARTLALPSRLAPLWRRVLIDGATSVCAAPTGAALNLYRAAGAPAPLRREEIWEHLAYAIDQARLPGKRSDYALRFHALRHHLASFLIERDAPFQRAAYWLGHQTAGNEHTHPVAGLPLRETWAAMDAHLNALLDELGATAPVMEAAAEGAARGAFDRLEALLPPATAGGADALSGRETDREADGDRGDEEYDETEEE